MKLCLNLIYHRIPLLIPINIHTAAMFTDRNGKQKQQYASALTSKIRSIANAAMIVFMLVAAGYIYIFGVDPSRTAMLTTGISPPQFGPTIKK